MRVRVMLALALLMRFWLIFRYRFDSDEPQHMHVAWGWANGFVQYRDLFDNHMPLFHLLTAPLFLGRGSDPRLLFAARLLMVPLFLIAVALVWWIAGRLFDETTAAWAAVFAALFPTFFLGSLEFRTDDLWLVFWLASIAVLLSDLAPKPRSAIAGLLIGCAFAVSMKTTIMVLAIAGAAAATYLLTRSRSVDLHWNFFLTMLPIPAAIFAAFALGGAWKPMFYDVIIHNVVPAEHPWRALLFIPLYPILRIIAVRIARRGDAKLLFVFGCAALFLLVLVVFWTRLSDEDFLPLYPLLALLAAPLIVRQHRLAPAFCAIACVVITLITAAPWRDEAHAEVELIDEVVEITTPLDPVFDVKGETVFRVRPWYFGLEPLTNARMNLGEIRDDIAEALVRTATHVVATDHLPPRARKFVEKNYVRWRSLFVSGVELFGSFRASDARRFHLSIPGSYVVLGGRAQIDGHDARRGVFLTAGDHLFVAGEREKNPTVIWSGALRRMQR